MIRMTSRAWLVLLALGLPGCNAPPPPARTAAAGPPAHTDAAAAPSADLEHIVERYWDDHLRLDPFSLAGGTRFGNTLESANSPQALADALALERRALAELSAVARPALDAEAALTYDIFRRQRVLAAESYRYPEELLPVNPYDGVPQRFALAARSLGGSQELAAWLRRADAFVQWTRQAIDNMRDGMRRGYTLPRPLVEKTAAVMAVLGSDTPNNELYLAAPAAGGTAAVTAVTTAVRNKILPAYRELHDFLLGEYLPRARDSVGLSALPLGDSWYGYLIKRETGGTKTPQELHALGATELERLHGRVQALLSEAAFPGNAASFLEAMRHDPRYSYSTAAALLGALRDLKAQTAAALPLAFPNLPRMDFEIRSSPEFEGKTTPLLAYAGERGNTKTDAFLYVNTDDLDARPATALAAHYLREAVPGRHLLLSLDHEHTDLPRFRRFGGDAPFIEGWALYATTLGDELNLYPSVEAKFGALLVQLTCAAGLVVDLGLHAEGWSRQQALDFVHAQVPLDEAAAQNLVDRSIALPADGLACTVGERKIQSLRARTQQSLGMRFDLKEFHEAILSGGAMPLDILEVRLKRWTDAVAN